MYILNTQTSWDETTVCFMHHKSINNKTGKELNCMEKVSFILNKAEGIA